MNPKANPTEINPGRVVGRSDPHFRPSKGLRLPSAPPNSPTRLREDPLFVAPRPGDWNNKKLMAWTEFKGGRKAPVPAWEIIPYLDNGKTAFKASMVYGENKLESGHNPVKELMATPFTLAMANARSASSKMTAKLVPAASPVAPPAAPPAAPADASPA